jgi:ribonuclease D
VENVPPYVIFHDKTLAEMAARYPRSVAELAGIPGVGEVKLARFGQAFLQIIKAHGMEPKENVRPDATPSRSSPPSPTEEDRLQTIKQAHPRAYEKWTQEEDAELLSLHGAGTALSKLAAHFRRQPSAIRSRLAKLAPESDSERSI